MTGVTGSLKSCAPTIISSVIWAFVTVNWLEEKEVLGRTSCLKPADVKTKVEPSTMHPTAAHNRITLADRPSTLVNSILVSMMDSAELSKPPKFEPEVIVTVEFFKELPPIWPR